MSLRRLIVFCVLAGLLVGGQPEGLVEELLSPEATLQEFALVSRTGRSRNCRPVASLQALLSLTAAWRPLDRPDCRRSRIRALPIARRGPPSLHFRFA